MINYLFSGIDKERGFTLEQSKYLVSDIKPNSKITFIASVFNNNDKNDSQVSQYIKLFQQIGIAFNNVNLIDNRITNEFAKKILENTDIIFLMGGSPELQMQSIKKYKIIDDIKKCKLVLGVSAGAMNQSHRVMYRDDFDNFIMKYYNGIGMVNINIFPHTEINNTNLLKEAKEISKEIPLILLPNDSFIRIENNKMKIVGRSYSLYKEKVILNDLS